MNKLLAALVAVGFALGGTAALAADAPAKDAAKDAKMAPAKLEKPADVKQEDWNKMTDAEKQKAVEKAKMAKGEKTAGKKEKKGGC